MQSSPARSAADATVHTEPNAWKYPHEHASRSLRSRAAGYLILAVRRCIRRCLRPSMMSRIHRGVLPRLTIIVFDATWDKLWARFSPGSWPISSEWRGQSVRSAGPPFCPDRRGRPGGATATGALRHPVGKADWRHGLLSAFIAGSHYSGGADGYLVFFGFRRLIQAFVGPLVHRT